MNTSQNPFGHLQVLLLTLPPERLAKLESCEEFSKDSHPVNQVIFREPIQEFEHSRLRSLICLVYDRSHKATHLAIGHRGYSGGTGLSQIEFTYAERIRHPFPVFTGFNWRTVRL